ncbi:glycosyltransferase [Kordiimonas aquimaris]|uniref:glycosyltransferase n=1 Tax=Kordiimonas aquimaris TaxID=707591 RepID=UPI0021D39F2A|nr:glycosyltransferase [Kordiimonas aquimaris]
MNWRPKVMALAPYCDGTDVGEAWCAYMWINELSKQADVTLISFERPGRKPLSEQLPDVTVISKLEPSWTRRFERINAMAKLSYPAYYRWAKRQIKILLKTDTAFDIGHQFSPIALRFPSPFKCFDLPYFLGPLGGSLSTPSAFEKECGSAAWYTRFRSLDKWRLSLDPMLKSSYRKASGILGVAPYVEDAIGHTNIRRFKVMSELGITELHERSSSKFSHAGLRLLHVGRGVRTKGLRDCVRAMELLRDVPGIHLDVAGKGEEMELCKELAEDLNISHLITFHGQITREEVDTLYSRADVFCFPSFREPSGSVVFEALSHGLPVIVADRGGPGHVVDDSCGFKVAVTEPDLFAGQIATAVRTLASMPELRRRLSDGAIQKMTKIGLWPAKIAQLLSMYEHVLNIPQNKKETSSSCLNHRKKPKSLPLLPEEAIGSKC